jgi:hypothetical protein
MFCDQIRDAGRGMYHSPYLDNDVLDTVGHTETLALDNTLVALTNQTLVGVDSDTDHTGLVVRQGRNLLLCQIIHSREPKSVSEQTLGAEDS